MWIRVKNNPKNSTKVENLIFFCILGSILHVLIPLVYHEKLKEKLLLLNTFCTPTCLF